MRMGEKSLDKEYKTEMSFGIRRIDWKDQRFYSIFLETSRKYPASDGQTRIILMNLPMKEECDMKFDM